MNSRRRRGPDGGNVTGSRSVLGDGGLAFNCDVGEEGKVHPASKGVGQG